MTCNHCHKLIVGQPYKKGGMSGGEFLYWHNEPPVKQNGYNAEKDCWHKSFINLFRVVGT